GWMAWNIEYRRVGVFGSCGWPRTLQDVAAAIDHLARIDGVDVGRVVACGHSAGGQLALWAAGRRRLPPDAPGSGGAVALRGAVSLAGVVDLVRGYELDLGGGAVAAFLGGDPEGVPERYATASPQALLPLGVPQVVVHGLADTTVPPALSDAYQVAATEAGDAVAYVPIAGAGHRDVIDPDTPAWGVIAGSLKGMLDSEI
ncbi:MAG: alpha/beta hydrolase family protein, partial [Acidimicrobiales bacterium]